jgi:MFS transporter, FSR family, fosmidomycin resistance protein
MDRNFMLRLLLPIVLGLAHGVADGAAGFLLFSLPQSLTLPQVGTCVLLYNALAFGGQPSAGLLIDRIQRPRVAVLAGLLLLLTALTIANRQPLVAVVLAGLGSAFFHSGGGALAVCATKNCATGPGLFAAPGVLGLAVGGALAVTGHTIFWSFLLLMFVGVLAVLPIPVLPYHRQSDERGGDSQNQLILLLLAAIALRSSIWNVFQFLLQGQLTVLLALAAAAATGKLLGGILADWLGWQRWAVVALLVATPLLVLGGQNLGTLLPGVALLQSVTPLALAATGKLLPQQPATAAGLALGLAIALGGFPFFSGLDLNLGSPAAKALILVAVLLFLWRGLRGSLESSEH